MASYDRFDSEAPADVADRQRAQVREMFRMADDRANCRHQAVTRYLGERMDGCGDACDVCTGRDLLATTAPAARTRRRRPTTGSPDFAEATTFTPAGLASGDTGADGDADLFERLRQLRREIAQARKLPAYLVFSDATLREMSARRPTTRDALLAITGVGPKKISEYGETFLALLRA